MRIIKANTKVWKDKITCNSCHSLLEVDIEDLKVINTAVGWAGETWEPELVYKCPVCDSYNQVTNKVPAGIRASKFANAAKNSR